MTSRARKFIAASVAILFFAIGSSYLLAQTEPQTVQPVVPMGAQTVTSQPDPAPSTQKNTTSPAMAQPQDILIGAGDLLQVRVFGVEELTQDVRVSTNGDINVPLIDSVHVADLTQSQAEDLIAAKLREGQFVNDPHVSVFTKEYATQGVSVLGEVTRPGVYPLLGAHKLFDVISMAGGLSNRAGKLVSITHRDDPDKIVNIEFSNDPTKANDSNLPISPGDTVVISKAGIVYVVGDVARPAGFIMDNNERMTVLQAVALAGGTNGTASLDRSKVIRKTPNGVIEIPMPLKKILSAKADDVALQAEDVLFIPHSAAKGAARRGAESILQVTTGLAVYGSHW